MIIRECCIAKQWDRERKGRNASEEMVWSPCPTEIPVNTALCFSKTRTTGANP